MNNSNEAHIDRMKVSLSTCASQGNCVYALWSHPFLLTTDTKGDLGVIPALIRSYAGYFIIFCQIVDDKSFPRLPIPYQAWYKRMQLEQNRLAPQESGPV